MLGATEQQWVVDLSAFDYSVRYRLDHTNKNADSYYGLSTARGSLLATTQAATREGRLHHDAQSAVSIFTLS